MFTSLLLYDSSVPEAKTEIQYQPQHDFTEQFPANCIVIVRSNTNIIIIIIDWLESTKYRAH